MEKIQMVVLILIFFILIGMYFWKSSEKKSKELSFILKGKCPSCNQDINNLVDIKKGGCGGVDTISLECNCGYSGSFNYAPSSCGI